METQVPAALIPRYSVDIHLSKENAYREKLTAEQSTDEDYGGATMRGQRARMTIGLLLFLIMESFALPMTSLAASAAGKDYCVGLSAPTVENVFAKYYGEHGGLPINGLALTQVKCETLSDGNSYLVQWFERVRLEYHPENAGTKYEVLLGHFGREIVLMNGGTIENGLEPDWRFIDYWRANGGLEQFGYPIGKPYREVLEDKKEYIVQYFERARFEYHPENTAPYDILLGRFGVYLLEQRNQPQPSTSPSPSASPSAPSDQSHPQCPKSADEAKAKLGGGKGDWRDLGLAPERNFRKWEGKNLQGYTHPGFGSFDNWKYGTVRHSLPDADSGTFNCLPAGQ